MIFNQFYIIFCLILPSVYCMQHKPILTTSTSIEFLHKSREHNFYKLHHNRSKRQTFDEIEATGNLDGLKTTDFGSCRFMPLMSSWSAEQIDNGLKCCNTMDPTCRGLSSGFFAPKRPNKPTAQCYCDRECVRFGDCCQDYQQTCSWMWTPIVKPTFEKIETTEIPQPTQPDVKSTPIVEKVEVVVTSNTQPETTTYLEPSTTQASVVIITSETQPPEETQKPQPLTTQPSVVIITSETQPPEIKQKPQEALKVLINADPNISSFSDTSSLNNQGLISTTFKNINTSSSVIANNFKTKISKTSNSPTPTLSQSVGYGCWCLFEEMPILSGQSKPFRPKGRPVDKLDGYCKSLNDAYECIAQDNLLDKNGDICDFKNTPKILTDNWQVEIDHDINSATTSIKTDAELKQACLTLNNNIDSCEVYICMIEANFLIQLWDPNQDFLNSNDVNQYGYAWETSQQSLSSNDLNGFNPYDQCLVNFNTASSAADDKSCCGEYPNRLTYRSKGGIFSCCNGKTFNSLMHACCDNNGNQVVGDIGC